MLSVNNITKIYPSKSGGEPVRALDGITFKINGPEFISIVGKSGAGKTTLLKLIIAEEKPTSGEIIFNDSDIHKLKKSKIHLLRQKMGIVFQDYKLFSSKTVYENVAFAMEAIGAKDEDIKRDVSQVLEIVGLKDKAKRRPLEISGGEKQRVSFARALVHRPEIILADEPTGNLDPYNTIGIIRLLQRIYEMGTTVILATHNKEIINSLGKRVITLEDGKIIRDEEKGRFVL